MNVMLDSNRRRAGQVSGGVLPDVLSVQPHHIEGNAALGKVPASFPTAMGEKRRLVYQFDCVWHDE